MILITGGLGSAGVRSWSWRHDAPAPLAQPRSERVQADAAGEDHRVDDEYMGVKRVLAKLGVSDRVHAVVFAYESGLVTPAP